MGYNLLNIYGTIAHVTIYLKSVQALNSFIYTFSLYVMLHVRTCFLKYHIVHVRNIDIKQYLRIIPKGSQLTGASIC